MSAQGEFASAVSSCVACGASSSERNVVITWYGGYLKARRAAIGDIMASSGTCSA